MRIPEKGLAKDEIFRRLEAFRADDVDWRSGRTWAYVYDPGKEAEEVIKQAYTMYLSENALDPTAFPSMLRLETERSAWPPRISTATPSVAGNFTSGGTESIILAVKTARDMRARMRPHDHRAEIVLPITAHAAFQKALSLSRRRAGAGAGRSDDASRPTSPRCARDHARHHPARRLGGLVCARRRRPIAELGALARGARAAAARRRLHGRVPAAVLSPARRRRAAVRLQRAPASPRSRWICTSTPSRRRARRSILYRDRALRRHQIYACARLDGLHDRLPDGAGTKSGGPLAAAWAALHFFGDEGYLALARQALDATQALVAALDAIPDLRVLGRPQMNLVAFTSDTVNVFHIIDEMKTRGWYVQPQLSFQGSKETSTCR